MVSDSKTKKKKKSKDKDEVTSDRVRLASLCCEAGLKQKLEVEEKYNSLIDSAFLCW